MRRFSIIFFFALAMTAVTAGTSALEGRAQDRSDLLLLTEPGSDLAGVMVHGLALHMGLEGLKVKVLPWARAYRRAMKEPGTMLFPTTRMPEREKLFQWVGPVMTVDWAFYALKGSDARPATLEQAKRVRRIGTYKDDARESFLRRNGFANLDSTYNQCTNFKKLIKGRVDLVAGSSITLSSMDPADRELVECVLVFKRVDLYLAFSPRTAPEIVEAWREGLESFMASGRMARYCCPLAVCPSRLTPVCAGL